MKFAFLLFGLTLLLQPIGQVLERKGMMQIGPIGGLSQLFSIKTILAIITNPYVVLGVACSAMGLILWLGVLSNMNISYIYPFGSISYIVLAILAMVFLHERLEVVNWAGITLIVTGCFLINA